ncbi:MAG TPA: ABC transporter permease [Tahibacter sp.]|nr:ABC transporter permease [Tahibacter sp.]
MSAVLAFDAVARRSFGVEVRAEFLRMSRTPSFVLPTLLFPPMFYVLFAIIMNFGRGSFQAQEYFLASYCVFGVMSPGLFGFGATIAMEREQGLLMLKRALPMPRHNYLAAKLVVALAFAATIYLSLALLAYGAGGVRLDAAQWLALGVVAIAGAAPFCALGFLIGTLTSGQGAPAVANLIYLPMAFLSGLALPLFLLPKIVQAVAPVWPAWHLGQVALASIGQPSTGSVGGHLAYLAVFTAVAFALASRRLARG